MGLKEVVGDIFVLTEVDKVPVVGICFTSNGVTKKDGRAVMGAGVAKAFRDKFKDLDLKYGEHLRNSRLNVTTDLGEYKLSKRKVRVIAFPTKNDRTHHSFSLTLE